MSVICSSHNLGEFEDLNRQLQVHCYALRLLADEDNAVWSDSRIQLLWERVSVLFDTVGSFKTLERCIRAGRDFNPSEPDFYDDSPEWAEPGYSE